jgi:uncharacterized SAM-binding protein YcdF (DUF218 family)
MITHIFTQRRLLTAMTGRGNTLNSPAAGLSTSRKQRRILRPRNAVLLLTPIVLLASLWLFRYPFLNLIGNFLVVHDNLRPADVIFVLNGGATVRPGKAASLFRRGLASRVVMARAEDSVTVAAGAHPNVTDSSIIMLEKNGVPKSSIVQLRPRGGVASTADEARALANWARTSRVSSVIVVTSDLHSRRTRFIFRKTLEPGNIRVMVAAVADLKYSASNWWTVEDGFVGCQNEYLKLVYYRLKY